jgi:ribosomal protein S18 acetylase RimI-like enzyme
MIRPTVPQDSAAIIQLTKVTGVFKPIEVEALKEVLDDYFATNQAQGHKSVTYEDHGTIVGYAYFAPTPMTVRTWHLYWIAVSKQTQAKGVGGKLLRHVEDAIRGEGGRMLLIETSTLPHYDLTRKFYLKHGYELDATVHDFYAEGDHMAVFRKRF